MANPCHSSENGQFCETHGGYHQGDGTVSKWPAPAKSGEGWPAPVGNPVPVHDAVGETVTKAKDYLVKKVNEKLHPETVPGYRSPEQKAADAAAWRQAQPAPAPSVPTPSAAPEISVTSAEIVKRAQDLLKSGTPASSAVREATIALVMERSSMSKAEAKKYVEDSVARAGAANPALKKMADDTTRMRESVEALQARIPRNPAPSPVAQAPSKQGFWASLFGGHGGASRPGPRSQTGVYLLSDGTGRYKIGKTTEFDKRLKALQTGNPNKIEVIGWKEAGSSDEAFKIETAMHRRFKDKNIKTAGSASEWFTLSAAELKEFNRA